MILPAFRTAENHTSRFIDKVSHFLSRLIPKLLRLSVTLLPTKQILLFYLQRMNLFILLFNHHFLFLQLSFKLFYCTYKLFIGLGSVWSAWHYSFLLLFSNILILLSYLFLNAKLYYEIPLESEQLNDVFVEL